MKSRLYAVLFVAYFFAACGGNETNALDAQKTKLSELKKQQNTLTAEIANLEQEIKKNSKEGEKQKTTLVQINETKPEAFNHYIELQGKIFTDKEINVNPKMPGVVSKIYVEVGQHVSPGQVLAVMDDAVQRQGKLELEHGIAFARDVFEKQKSLWDQKIGSEIQYLSAKSNLESLEKKMQTFNEQSEMYRIKSPISGVVDQIDIKIGQAASPGFPCIKVVNLSGLKASVSLGESYISKVKQGNLVQIHIPDLDKVVSTRLKYVGQSVDPVNRTFNAEAQIPGGIQGLRPNMVAIFKIIDYSKPNCIVLPINVIQKGMDGDFVFLAVKEGNSWKAMKTHVKTGLFYNDKIEILEGIKSGDRIIESGFQELNNGDLVEIK